MEITLKYLKKAWSQKRINNIRHEGLTIGTGDMLLKKYSIIWGDLDCVWDIDFKKTLRRRNCHKKNGTEHIFVSEMCDIATQEYKQVQEIIGFSSIRLIIPVNSKVLHYSLKELLPKFTCIDIRQVHK